MTRTTATSTKATITLAIACTTALVFSVAAVQARPTHSAGTRSAATALSNCTLVISGAPWHIRGRTNLSGTTYTLKGRDISCASVRDQVVAFTHRKALSWGPSRAPAGFKCTTFWTASSGDALLAQVPACARRTTTRSSWGQGAGALD